MKKSLIIFCLFCIHKQIIGQNPYSKETKERIAKVENGLYDRLIVDGHTYNIEERMKHYKVKGLSIAVIENYKVVWAKGYGWADVKQKRPVTTETLFKPGSISKSINAIGLLKLAQEAKLNLYRDINDYLVSWKFPYDSLSKGKKITIANLLSHTGGLSVYGGYTGYDKSGKIPTITDILDGKPKTNAPPVRSMFEPGLKFEYSGGGTLISQLIITDQTKQSYENFIYDNVLKPIGMPNSYFSAMPPDKDQQKKIALGYDPNGNIQNENFLVYPVQATQGLWTTPTELSHYIIETQLAYQGKSSKVINQQMAKLHLIPYLNDNVAMGTFVQERGGTKYFFHDASNWGYYGMYFASLEGGNGMVIFTNSNANLIGLEVMNAVALAYSWPGFEKPENLVTVKVSKTLKNKYTGLYVYDGVIAEVTQNGNEMTLWANGQNCKMLFTSDKDFINIEFPTKKRFLMDQKLQVTGYSRILNGEELKPAIKVNSIDNVTLKPDQENMFCWHLIETKRFEMAQNMAKNILKRNPDNINAKRYLAHTYLLTLKYEEAVNIYKTYLSSSGVEQNILIDNLVYDLKELNKNGLDNKLILRLRSELKF